MTRLVWRGVALAAVAAVAGATLCAAAGIPAGKILYPPAREVEQLDTYHGQAVADPYRWLEGDLRAGSEVSVWVEAQNRLSQESLRALPERASFEQRLEKLWSGESRWLPTPAGSRSLFLQSDGRQEHAILYLQGPPSEAARPLLDPNRWSSDGSARLTNYEPSPDGKYLAYGTSEGGSDWQTYHVLEIDSGRVLGEELPGIKTCCAAWTRDSQGFFYGAYPDPKKEPSTGLPLHHRIYFHQVGTAASSDRVVYERPDHPDWFFFPQLTADRRHLLLTVARGTGERFQILIRDLETDGTGTTRAGFRELVPHYDNRYLLFVSSQGSRLYFRTDNGAPNGRLVAIDLEHPERERWRDVIPTSERPLTYVSRVGSRFVGLFLDGGRTRAEVFSLDGRRVREIDLPGIGIANGFEGTPLSDETFYSFGSWTEPATIYRYDVESGQSTRVWRREIDFDPARFEVRQVLYPSRDGTSIPLYVASLKGLPLDGDRPTLLTGYGGFAIPVSLTFSTAAVAWMERGGVYAAASLRGGGERGEAWHQAGMRLTKQNTFDDFLAAADWLIANQYTRPRRLGILGTSNGGLLVGAALTKKPGRFGAAVAEVGLFDMLRYDKLSAARNFVSEYGSADDPAEFKVLQSYSPYHHVQDGTRYPATLLVTAENDTRVVPAHSFKMAARLQRAQAGDAPILLSVERRSGHGLSSRTQALQTFADEMAFLAHHLGLKEEGKPPHS
ncbi:MAG TPA: prolyl oligopeptidase family serine peptidase [Thermoanaerobaculia bacterium]|nr:prolyl oligopeptidase family serine peptidase [Thermoanaerobaculia bacterium]